LKSSSQSFAGKLAARKSGTGVQALLTTPLLVTLLAIVYQASQSVPNNIAEFYNKLFEMVFLRHDQTKAAFKRRLSRSRNMGQSTMLRLVYVIF
jgi:hypothetical protein